MKPETTKSLKSFCPIFICILSFFLIVSLILLSGCGVFAILVNQGKIIFNSSSIRLPEGKALFDLGTYTYRNETLYSYHKDVIIGDVGDDEEFDPLYTMREREYGGKQDVAVVTLVPHEDMEFKFTCDAKCSCFDRVDEEYDDRRITPVQVWWILGVSVVAAIPFTVYTYLDGKAKEECAREARESGFVEPQCEVLEETCDEDDDGLDDNFYGSAYYDCQGHCMTRMDLDDDETRIAQATQCETKQPVSGEQILIKEKMYPENSWNINAKVYYADRILEAYCHQFRYRHVITEYVENAMGEYEPMIVYHHPCVARAGDVMDNVKCKLAGTEPY